jgi:hypothetical protein
MKNVLLGTTALIGAAVLAAPAQAQLEVTVGGYTAFQAGWFDNDASNSSDRDFQSEAQIVVRADGTADNGLQYGAKVALDTSTSDSSNADETNVYLAGGWGRVEMGDEDGASELGVTAPTVGIGQINGSYDDFVVSTDRGHQLNDRGDARFKPLDTDDDTKVTYYTPNVMGFQAGVSYVPEANNGGAFGENVQFSDAGSGDDVKDVFELGLRYSGEFQGVGVTAGGQYNAGSAKATNVEDLRAWGLGAQLAYMGFTVGAGYTDNSDSLNTKNVANDDVSSWNLGATYSSGPWGVGVSYLDTDFSGSGSDSNGAAGSDGNGGDYTVWALGATYTVAPGLTTGVDAAFYNRDRVAGADTDGTVLMMDVTASF